MGIKRYKPTAAARRLMTVSDFAEITRSRPEKSLTESQHKSGGRNQNGHITRRHQGGGLPVPWPDWLGVGRVDDMPDSLASVSEFSGDLADGHAIASSPPNRAVIVHREHVLGLRGVIDPCGNVHPNEGGFGGTLLHDHIALKWDPLTRSFPPSLGTELCSSTRRVAESFRGGGPRPPRGPGATWSDLMIS